MTRKILFSTVNALIFSFYQLKQAYPGIACGSLLMDHHQLASAHLHYSIVPVVHFLFLWFMILLLHKAELKLVGPLLLFSDLRPVGKGARGDGQWRGPGLVNETGSGCLCISPFTVQTRESGLWKLPENVLRSVPRSPLSELPRPGLRRDACVHVVLGWRWRCVPHPLVPVLSVLTVPVLLRVSHLLEQPPFMLWLVIFRWLCRRAT